MRSIRLVTAATLLAASMASAWAQANYPDHNIKLLFGFAPGLDIAVRILADKLSEALGKPVVVENVTGAGGNIAADRTTKAAPDGYTIGVLSAANIVVNPSLYKKLSYDPVKDLAPVTEVYEYPNLLVVNNEVPAKNVQELVALARASPGKLTFGHAGLGTSLYLSGELLNFMAQIDVQPVPFRGTSLVTDLVGGRISMSFSAPMAVLSLIREGKIRGLAVTSLKRASFVPELSTMDESGFPGFDVTTWFGMFVPAGTSSTVIDRLNRETVKIMASTDVRDKLRATGNEPVTDTPAEFAHMIQAKKSYWARTIKEMAIEPLE